MGNSQVQHYYCCDSFSFQLCTNTHTVGGEKFMFKFLSGELLNDFMGRSRNRRVGLIDCGYTRKENQILNRKIIAGKLQISQSNETGIWKHPRGVYKKNRFPFQTFLSQLFFCLCAYHKKVLQSLSTKWDSLVVHHPPKALLWTGRDLCLEQQHISPTWPHTDTHLHTQACQEIQLWNSSDWLKHRSTVSEWRSAGN